MKEEYGMVWYGMVCYLVMEEQTSEVGAFVVESALGALHDC